MCKSRNHFKLKYPIKLDVSLYLRYKKKIINFSNLNRDYLSKINFFFFWIFNVIKGPRFSFLKLKNRVTNNGIVKFNRKNAPIKNLRIYSLYSRIMKHGKSEKAKNLILKVIILLTETTQEKSGCFVLNKVLESLEPAVGLLVYRRGLNFYNMPVPLWPARKMFLASQFLVKGIKRRQVVQRCSFLSAFYFEILDIYTKKADSYTLKIFYKYRKDILKVEAQAWRTKKKQF